MIVAYRTPWSALNGGWCVASRGYARAMALAGLDVHLESWSSIETPEVLAARPPSDEILRELDGVSFEAATDREIEILSTWLSGTPLPWIDAFVADRRSIRVLYVTFERQEIDAAIVEQMNALDGVCVPCTWNAESLVNAGVCAELVKVFPHVYFADDSLLSIPTATSARRLYWIGTWQPRKAPHNLIRAFLRAFRPGDGVTLTLKTGGSWRGYRPPEAVIVSEAEAAGWPVAEARKAITIVREVLSKDQMVGLHARHDIYVDASRGEGFGLGAFAAKLAGRRCVATDSGGPRDFLTADDLIVPRTGLVPVAEHFGLPQSRGCYHADYSVDALTEAMRRAVDMPPPVRADMSRFEGSTVGANLKIWFESLIERKNK